MKKKLNFFLYGNIFSFYSLILQEHKLRMSAAIRAILIAFTAFAAFATAPIATVIQEYTHMTLHSPPLFFLFILFLLLQAFAYLMVFVVSVKVFTEKLSENMQLINELKAKNMKLVTEKNDMIISLKHEIDELTIEKNDMCMKFQSKIYDLETDKNNIEDNLNIEIIYLKHEISDLMNIIANLDGWYNQWYEH